MLWAMRRAVRARVVTVVVIACTFACARAPRTPDRGYVAVIGIPTEVTRIEAALAGVTSRRVQGLAFDVGTLGPARVVLVRSGIGKVNAAMVATLLVDHFHPAAVFFT